MSMRVVMVIARKELRDVLRDRRTLFFMMLLPIVVMPLMLMGVTKFMTKQAAEKQERTLMLAMDASTQNTLRALGTQWFNENGPAYAVLLGKQGADALGGLAGMRAMIAGDQTPEEAEVADMSRILKLSSEMEPEERELLQDAAAVMNLLVRSEFVDLASLEPGGALAQGVEIPEDLPGGLSDERIAVAIQEKRIEAALHLPSDALVVIEEAGSSLPMHVLYDSSQSLSKEAYDRIANYFEAVDRLVLRLRVHEYSLPVEFARPMTLERANVATASRKIQALLGGLLPYLIFAFCFFGALYPALDVTAGEKERFTMETLLLGPVSRLEIAVGKFLVVFLAALVAAVLTTASIVLSLGYGILPADLAATFEIEFQPLALLLTGSLVLPVAALYSALLLAVGLYARSFKEAQSYTVPLQFLLILPMMVSLLPDVEADSHLAWIPFVNISMLMKELLKGNYLWGFYAITLVSTLVLTVLALLLTAWMFRRESVMLRT